jgi:TonB family protein
VPLDEFKTQVLLLHSEQSTLDDLRSGFTDHYTVHCATSGSEALNTLVETPINILISAQELPGMSGLEALREAKKRSPDTLGILLAGSKTTDIEALVGDEEVFQVVSGTVTGDGLLTLVDNAARQMRLTTLGVSANDVAANVDESAEHIVMETSENGSTIISDGTGKMPNLDPKKVSAAANVGSRAVDVLVMTKDQEFLETIKDSSRGTHKVHYANTLGQANDAISKNKIGVAVVDAAMAGEKIEHLTVHLRKGSPRLVCIVAGRRDDGDMLMGLINRGKVYRFLLKPVSPGRARLAVESSAKHHLEAPDAAFENIDAPPGSKPAPIRAAADPADPPFGSISDSGDRSPIDEEIANAFDDKDSSFTETVTGLFSTIGSKLSSEKESDSVSMIGPADATRYELSTVESGSGGSLFRAVKVIGIAVIALAVVGGGIYWFLTAPEGQPARTEETLSPTSAAVVDAEPKAESSVADTPVVSALVDEARLARDAGRIFSPDGRNAIELFAGAMALDPDNSLIAVEMDAVIVRALASAETALLESRTEDTIAALERVGSVDPQNRRLPFLTAQLSQMQLRTELDSARAAIRDERFEDAGIALSVARGLNVSNETEIDTLDAELTTARSEQQADDVLAKAIARLDSGDLLSPSNDNARYYYQLVLTNDPGNSSARQGLSVIAGKLAFQARNEIDKGELNLASDTLASAIALDPESDEVRGATEALESKRAEIAEQDLLDETDRQALAEQPAAAAIQAEADRLAAAEQQAEAERLGQERISSQADETTVAAPILAPISVSALTRTKYSAPKYPRSAQRRNQSGWVDVVFTVTTDGSVKDIKIRESEPGDTFVNSATKAIEKWEFEPVLENGQVVEKRAGVRLMFALE